ncbi:NAD-dependent epimerase/dehydratase family protein [Priestia megaterium]|uniref:NAD-dependent epimerase/dehydratase family protein n=1 Tax=Priestia megaterium TaxID=1404 RepID=UPI0012D88A74|nr:NAD-dependent epimerase/dehydratase family protein [Priestia megaterium]MUL34446.1 3 beta-hydroxysteroid dehydrogenase/Delta 5-->4-isomerase [Priestia megaterium]
MSSDILVTGATGFVGSNLLKKLIEKDARVRCFVRNGKSLKESYKNIEIFEGDLLNEDSCFEALKGIKTIYHVAGLGLSKIVENPLFNEQSTQTLLQAANRCNKELTFVYVSSIKAVGPCSNGGINENKNYEPTDSYGISKANAEKKIFKHVNSQIKYLIVRPPAIYGPGDQNLLPLFKFINRGIQPVLLGNNLSQFGMVYVEDLVDCLLNAPSIIKHSDILNISNNELITWNYFFSVGSILSSNKIKRVYLPHNGLYHTLYVMAKVLALLNKTQVLPLSRVNDLLKYNWVTETVKLEEQYGLYCKTPLTEGIEKTYNWYLKNKWL